MKKSLRNSEILGIMEALSDKECFIYTMRMPAKIRHAIRINQATLADRAKLIEEERKDIIMRYVEDKRAVIDGDKVSISQDARDDFVNEINELSEVENNIELEQIDEEVLDDFLDTHDLTIAEENLLLYFK